MKNIFLFLYVILTLNVKLSYSSNVICGNSPDDIFYISSSDDIVDIKNCNIINGSIFIHSGTDIEHLYDFRNISRITGYLLLWNNDLIQNILGFNNLEKIDGLRLYMNQYFVYIQNNNGNNSGLCFADTINWSMIGNNGDYLIENNGINCPTCSEECQGCWGVSPRLCQTCQYFMSGNTCVNSCPNGTLLQNNTNICLENIPTKPLAPDGYAVSSNHIHIEWVEPNPSNGVIIKYILYRNNIPIFETYFTNPLYNEDTHLQMFFEDTLLNIDTYYNYRIQAFNSMGSSIPSNITSIKTLENIPSMPEQPTITQISSTFINITWNEPIPSNGYIIKYDIYIDNNYNNTLYINNDDELFYIIYNLEPFTNYTIQLQAFTIIGGSPLSLPLSFITSESIPERLDIPLLNITNNTINISWSESQQPNGIVTHYMLYMYTNNNLNIVSVNTTQYSISPIQSNMNYTFQVQAFTTAGGSVLSSTSMFISSDESDDNESDDNESDDNESDDNESDDNDENRNESSKSKNKLIKLYIILLSTLIPSILIIILIYYCKQKNNVADEDVEVVRMRSLQQSNITYTTSNNSETQVSNKNMRIFSRSNINNNHLENPLYNHSDKFNITKTRKRSIRSSDESTQL